MFQALICEKCKQCSSLKYVFLELLLSLKQESRELLEFASAGLTSVRLPSAVCTERSTGREPAGGPGSRVQRPAPVHQAED